MFSTWPEAFRLLRDHRFLFIPVGVSAIAKTVLLALALLAPFPPFSNLLAPVIRYFWSEIYLHYPYHLGLASRWFRRLDLFLPVFLEGFLIAMAALLVRQVIAGRPAKLRQVFADAFRRYPALLILTLINVLLALVLVQAVFIPIRLILERVSFLAKSPFTAAFLPGITTLVVIAAVESLFIFAIPLCVMENRPWGSSLVGSIRTSLQAYRWIFLTILAVTLCYLPVILVRQGSMGLVEGPWPESILLIYAARIVVAWLLNSILSVWAAVYLLRTAAQRVR